MEQRKLLSWLNINVLFTKRRLLLLVALLFVIPLGLSTRKYPVFFPDFIAEFGGDTLYAVMVYLLCAFVFVRKPILFNAAFSAVFCYCIEVLQLYDAEWFESIRNTRLGGLVLGYGFLWSDIVCYSVGVLMCAAIDLLLVKIYPLKK